MSAATDWRRPFLRVDAPAERAALPQVPLKLLHGRCGDDFLDGKLAPAEAAAYRATQVASPGRVCHCVLIFI
jgi:hypothetical protein